MATILSASDIDDIWLTGKSPERSFVRRARLSSGPFAAAEITRTVILADRGGCIDAAGAGHAGGIKMAGSIEMAEHRLDALEQQRAASDPGRGHRRRAQKAAAPHSGYDTGIACQRRGCQRRRIAGLSGESWLLGVQ